MTGIRRRRWAPTPLDNLADHIGALLEAGTRVPCIDRPEWTSDRPAERADATQACQPCPLAAECLAAALGARPPITFGVFGGHDLDPEAKPER